MSITSFGFLFFLITSLILYWIIPGKYQWIVLLTDSLIFYFFNATWYTFAYILFSTLSVFLATECFKKGRFKKQILVTTIILNVGILVALKYTNLFINTYNFFLGPSTRSAIDNVSWLPSLAISFYTLQLISYLIDSYYEVIQPIENPIKLMLYTCFFPLMVSGPICRYKDIGTQLFADHRFDYDNASRGMRRIAWGIAKKAVVADRLALVVDYMFAHHTVYTGVWTIIAGVMFTVELYFDFSGCMDIMIGASMCFGIPLPENFRAPFFSKSIREIWQRWHISLGTWLKDYIMYPILRSKSMTNLSADCKKRFGKKGKIIPSSIAMFVVWTLMGLWHGNSWKYIIGEGWYFWVIITVSEIISLNINKKKTDTAREKPFVNLLRMIRTFLLFSIGMIFFRASDLFVSIDMIRGIITPPELLRPLRLIYSSVWKSFGGIPILLNIVILCILQFFADYLIYNDKKPQDYVVRLPWVLRWTLYVLLISSTIMCGSYGSSGFIYFGF